jgi:hypothetical protein
LPAAVRLKDPHVVPSGENQPRFPVFFPRNDESDAVTVKIGEIGGVVQDISRTNQAFLKDFVPAASLIPLVVADSTPGAKSLLPKRDKQTVGRTAGRPVCG